MISTVIAAGVLIGCFYLYYAEVMKPHQDFKRYQREKYKYRA